MSKLTCVLLLLLVSVFSSADDFRIYNLGAGDLVSITVYDEPDLSLKLRIGSSGSISYPLLGDIEVAGLTAKEFETELVRRLKGPYLLDPSVSVAIIEYRPFYVMGEVDNPGSYSFYPGMTVDRAISIAGGFTDRASKDKIFVEHDLTAVKVDERADAKNKAKATEKIKLSDIVRPGDVITVKQSFF
ncbi:MAG: polysaccharide export protein [Oleibacter sp.]|nr:polysaccharide export protein [Thalassolituus sp.]